HPTAVRPYFVADAPGNYIVAVHVTSKGETSTDLMNVNVASWWNEGYVITSDEGSGADIDAEVGSLVRVDPMIDSYHSTHGDWQLQSPLGSNTWVSGAHDASYQEFVPDKQGVYFLNGGLHISVDVAREYYAPFDSRHLLMNVVDLDGDGLEDRLYIEDERFLDSEDDPDILAVYSTEPTNPYLFKKDFGQWATLFELADLDDDGRKEIVTRRLLDENTMTLQVAFPAATLGSFKTPVETDAFVYDSDCGVSFHELRLPDGEPLLYLWSRNYGAHACPMPAYQAWKWNGSSLEPYTGTLDAEWFAGELIYLDFDNDDLTDVAVLDRHLGSTITLWRGQADNTYVNAGTLSDPNPVELTAGDVNGDGKDELVVASGIRLDPADYRGAQLFRDLDTTGFASRTILFDGNYDRSLYSPVLRDINDDGRKDFVVLQTGYSPHVVFAMQREDGTFEAPYTVPVDRSPHNGSLLTLHWFDINGDGEEDLIVGGRLVMFARPVD
ncbi:MAG: VCBS repeat-containing protein, partial [Proteobacteria bacterium]|nr:VCBS repeat-containing protein [Pseudomonadota bacterium]